MHTRQNQAKAHTFALVGFTAGVPGRVVVVPTPRDPEGIRRCARDVRTWSAAKNHTDEERGGRRDPGVRQPGAGRSQLPARSKSAMSCSIISFSSGRIVEKIRLPTKNEFQERIGSLVHYSILNNYCHARTITAFKYRSQATPSLFGTKSVSIPETRIV